MSEQCPKCNSPFEKNPKRGGGLGGPGFIYPSFECGSYLTSCLGLIESPKCLRNQLAAMTAERDQLQQLVRELETKLEAIKNHQREQYASATEALGIAAPCDRSPPPWVKTKDVGDC